MINRYRSIWEIRILINLQPYFPSQSAGIVSSTSRNWYTLIACSIRCQLIAPPDPPSLPCTQCHSDMTPTPASTNTTAFPFISSPFLRGLLDSHIFLFAQYISVTSNISSSLKRRLRIIPFYVPLLRVVTSGNRFATSYFVFANTTLDRPPQDNSI